MVEVFKTNVTKAESANELLHQLQALFPGTRFNFDLGDCDKILRAEGPELSATEIISRLKQEGYRCRVLDY